MSPADARAVLSEFGPGRAVYIQGAVGEPLALRTLLQAEPSALDGVSLTSCLLPGINEFDYAGLSEGARLTTFMLPAASRAAYLAGRVTVMPLAYSEIAAHLAAETFDLAIFQTSAADDEGWCGFGPCADFPALVFERARRRVAFVNSRLPATPRGLRVRLGDFHLAVDAPGPFITGSDEAESPVLAAIAETVAAEVPDGAAIQTGIGGTPAAVIGRLAGRRGLVVRSGMVTPGYRALAEAGALADGAEHVTGLALGPEGFMAWAAATFTFADVFRTHGAERLAATPHFTAINSALEVDLFGQVNLEWRDGRLFGGLGGAPDFARAARRSPGGRSILAFPAAARGGALSRITPRLSSPTVSLARNDADLIVTEHGAADLRGAGMATRARHLIAIAAPQHRESLERAWREIGRT